MASIKIKFRASSWQGKEGVLYYQIIHNRVVRQLKTNYRVFPEEWDEELSAVVIPVNNGGGPYNRTSFLTSLQEHIRQEMEKLGCIADSFERKRINYSADDVIANYRKRSSEHFFFCFMQAVIDHLKQSGKARTGEAYTATLSSFRKFRNGKDILAEAIDSDLMVSYEAWLKGNGTVPNTSSFYMRNLRAVYNRAVEKDITTQRHPFKHVYTGVDKTVKRAVPIKEIKRMKEMDLSLNPVLDQARDLFLFSFYTRGMSFIDMAYLKRADLKNGFLSYRRRKTGRRLLIGWEKCMQEIVNKYTTSASSYLLPIIKEPDGDERRQYKNALSRINQQLKKLGKRLGLSVPLTMYVARHSWASVARSRNIPVSVISEGMGHDSELTTRIYLASLDTTVIDKANRLILKGL